MSSVVAWQQVQDAIAQACLASGRERRAVELVAVSKRFDAASIVPVLQAGQRVFGENRVQEAMAKWPALRAQNGEHGGPTIELHLIGPLQSNKAADAVATFDVIQTVDREKIADALANEMARQGRALPCLVQVNTGDEPQKAGVSSAETAAFVQRCREVHGLMVHGLMCIPPVDADPAEHFSLLARLAQETGCPARSMGMSADFELAIACGATYVRLGSAIFGTRS